MWLFKIFFGDKEWNSNGYMLKYKFRAVPTMNKFID